MKMTISSTSAGFKCLALTVLVCAATGFSSLRADTRYWNGTISQDWTDPNNFQLQGSNDPGVPQAGDTVFLESWATQGPFITNSGNAALSYVYLSTSMTIGAGGVFQANDFEVGYDASATLNVMTNGSLSAFPYFDVGGYNGGTATVNISGGSVTVGQLILNWSGASTGASYLNITGGTITESGPLSINSTHPAVVNLAGGMLILPASNSGNVTYWIGSGNITAYGGSGTVNVDSVSSPGNIVLTGVPATTWFWNGDVSQAWSDPNNFQSSGSNLPGLPGAGNSVFLEPWAVRGPLINNGGYAFLNGVYLSTTMAFAPGGELDASVYKVGWDDSGTLDLSGGTLSATNHLDVGGYNGGTATLNVSNGTATVGGLYLNLSGDTTSVGGSQVSLTGGTLADTGALSISEAHPTLLNVAGGTLVVPSSQLGNVTFWMNDGSISAYGVSGTTNSFYIDQTTLPGSLVITSVYPGFVEGTFGLWDPQVITNLPSSLDQSMPLVPAGLAVLTNANYSFGVAVYTNGDVYFTENGTASIQRYSVASQAVTTVVSSRPAVFGIAADPFGNIFYAEDSDTGTGQVIERTFGGSETSIITGLTRPRQLTADSAGNIYVVLEGGAILKWTKSTSTTSTLMGPGQVAPTPEGVAVAPDGTLYFSTYGRFGGAGTCITEGAVWVRNTNSVVSLLAGGFARTRGLALAPNGDLYVAAEANVWDDGCSGFLAKIGPNKVVTVALQGLDYPQMPAIGANGIMYVALARDNKLVSYDPANGFVSQVAPKPGITLIAQGATWQTTAGNNAPIQVQLTDTNNPADSLTVAGFLAFTPGATNASLWLSVPVTNFNISLAQLPNSSNNTNSGMFQLPAASVSWGYGAAAAQVIPLREHQGCRWPMTNVGDPALEAPAAGFAETPTAYLVYVTAAAPPTLAIQPWTNTQVRVSWPSWATAGGYSLLRSTTLNGGYASPGLTVTVEGSNSVAYDTIGTGARFYRLLK